MANFCQQCSLDLFGKDFRELRGNREHYDQCETCGYVLVNAEGKCVDPNCRVHGTSTVLYCHIAHESGHWFASGVKSENSWVQLWRFPFWFRKDHWIYKASFLDQKALEDCLAELHGNKIEDRAK